MFKRHEGAFDPYTRHVASGGRDQRLLTLDGAQKTRQSWFLGACWAMNIALILLSAKMSGRFRPLDVSIFNTLNSAYH